MYKIFVKNLAGFSKIFKDDERLVIARPLYLLEDLELFNQNQQNNTEQYQNLYAIIEKVRELRDSQKYHCFGMFLQELYLQCFDFKQPSNNNVRINEDIFSSQLSLLYQFMFPAYYS
jgi:hypothetical protein